MLAPKDPLPCPTGVGHKAGAIFHRAGQLEEFKSAHFKGFNGVVSGGAGGTGQPPQGCGIELKWASNATNTTARTLLHLLRIESLKGSGYNHQKLQDQIFGPGAAGSRAFAREESSIAF